MLPLILHIDAGTVPAGAAWPGEWVMDSGGRVEHIATGERLAALQTVGCQTKVISYQTWAGLAGVVLQ